MEITTVYIVRHCQSIANSKRLYNSKAEADEGLSDIGLLQAEYVGQHFASKKIDLIVTSPFKRTVQTSKAIEKYTKAKIIPTAALRELDCGEWDGETEDKILEKFPEAWRGWHYDPQNNPIPGGESLIEVQVRALSEFESVVKKNPGKSIVFVTHYCVFNVLMCSLLASLANFRSFDTSNGSIAEIRLNNVPRLQSYFCPVKSINTIESHP
ncbi:MAG: histidine phosphatase family protein [Candidatus Bilamarchaeum sp.]|jgi:probable phosphoglycerate mutase